MLRKLRDKIIFKFYDLVDFVFIQLFFRGLLLLRGTQVPFSSKISKFSINWPHQLSEALRIKGIANQVSLIATTGWRTDDLIAAINASPQNESYDKVSILIGVNNQYQGKPLMQFEQELDVIISLALERCGGDTSALFFVSIPDYAYSPYGSKLQTGKISAELDTYNAYTAIKARELNVPFVDITPSSRTSAAHMFASDGLHPSTDQYAAWVNLILEQVAFK